MKGWLLDNLGWKIFSLVTATVLWLTFVNSPDLVTSITAPVEYLNVPADMELIPDTLERIRLEVRGPAARIHQFERSSPAVVLDLREIKGPSERTFNITAEHVRLPPGLTLVRAIPSRVHLRVERRLRRLVPVRAHIVAVPAGFRVESWRVEPAELAVVGPESRVRRVEFVETDPLECTAVAGEQTLRTYAFLRDPELRLESSGALTVRIRVAPQGKPAGVGESAGRE